MLNGARITKSLLKDMEVMKKDSELSLLKSRRIITKPNIMTLYDLLLEKGYKSTPYASTTIDILAQKWKLIRLFHKPGLVTDDRFITKNGVTIFFDDWHVDIIENGSTKITFDRQVTSEYILNFIKNREREIKLKRLLK